jgi:alcohol dehydrogenase
MALREHTLMMRALAYREGQLQFREDEPTPVLQPGQALLKIRKAGLCHTDLELSRGYLGFSGVLGHEFVAEVVDGSPEWVGKRVAGEINVPCGTCDMCRHDVPSQCRNRTTVGIDRHPGAFADYLALDERCLHVLPDTISDDAAVFVEPLAAALHILEATHILPGHRVVLVGAGKLGLLMAQVVAQTGADLTVVSRRDSTQALLKRWGIASALLEDLPLAQADVVIESTGAADGFDGAMALVKPRGTMIMKSTFVGLTPANLTKAVIDEIRLIGSRCGPFDAAIRMLANGRIDTQSLIDARYPFADALAAFEHAQRPGALKVMLDF